MAMTEDFGDLGNSSRDLKADPQVMGPGGAGPSKDAKAAKKPAASPAAARATGELDPHDGLTIDAAARQLGISEADVWAKLRRGELIGRTEAGKLLIFAHPFTAATGESLDDDDASPLPPLPPLPGFTEEPRIGATTQGPTVDGATTSPGWLTPQVGADGGNRSTELALFIDYMSLAKEENQQLLRLTQDSIRKVSEMSDTIVQMKDAVIEAKDSTIVALKEQMSARDQEIRKLRQQMEDLEMLARTMATSQD